MERLKRVRFGWLVLNLIVIVVFMAACSSRETPVSEYTEAGKETGSSEQHLNVKGERGSLESVIEAAKTEDELAVFGLSADPGQKGAMEQALSDYYGFDFQFDISGGLHPQKIAEIIGASRSGVPPDVDVFLTGIFDLTELKKEGLLEEVPWEEEFAVFSEYTALDGIGVRFFDDTPVSISYNKEVVPEDEVPTSYEDLLDSKWTGKITTVRSANWFAMMASVLGEEYTDRFVEGIADQLVYSATFPDILSRVASGEFPLGIGSIQVTAVKQGAPIASAPIDPMIVYPWSAAVLKGAQSPNLAKLFVYFLSTDEGQAVVSDQWGYSRLDIAGTYVNQMVQGKEIMVLSEDNLNAVIEAREKYSTMLGFD